MAGIKPQAIWSPADEALAITPSDSGTMPGPPNGFKVYVGVAGTVVVDMALSGSVISFVGAAAGSVLPIMVTRVRAATTATNLVALW